MVKTTPQTQSRSKWRQMLSWLKRRSTMSKFSLFILFLSVCAGIATYLALTDAAYGSPNHIIFLLNIDLILLLIIIFSLATRIIGLWRGREEQVASKLHVQLVFIFGLVAALPAVIMTVFSAGFFYFGVHTWFSERVKTAIDEANIVAQSYLEEHQQTIKADALAMASDLNREYEKFYSERDGFQNYMRTQAFLRNLSDTALINKDREIILRAGSNTILNGTELPDNFSSKVTFGEALIISDPESERVSALVPIQNLQVMYLFVDREVDEAVLSRVARTKSAAEEYDLLNQKSKDFQRSLTLIFSTVALLLIMSAIWFGLLMARKLVRPIGKLIQAAEKIREGDLSTRLEGMGSAEEFNTLATEFNSMTDQLQKQRIELIDANEQIDERRRFTETVLAGVSSGVIGVGSNRHVTLINDSAAQLLGKDVNKLLDQPLKKILPAFDDALTQVIDSKKNTLQSEIEWADSKDQTRVFLVRIASEQSTEEDFDNAETVITFDDITQLQQAQRKAAWADVARRIAHEIKNPLTPIQLSAERLKRRYMDQITESPEVFSQCTDTIVKHVEDIQRMVNEFSSFGRMPEPQKANIDLLKLTQECVTLQKQAHTLINIDVLSNSKTKKNDFKVHGDPHLLRQAITNLIQNAVDAITEKEKISNADKEQIFVVLDHDIEEQMIRVDIIDSGKGLPQDKESKNLIEPYVTTRQKGTGLGLAIVSKIVEDHDGFFEIQALDKKELQKYNIKSGTKASIMIKSGLETHKASVSDKESKKRKAG